MRRVKEPKPCSACGATLARAHDRRFMGGRIVCRSCFEGDTGRSLASRIDRALDAMDESERGEGIEAWERLANMEAAARETRGVA